MRTARGKLKGVDRAALPFRGDRLVGGLEVVDLVFLRQHRDQAQRTFRGAGGQFLAACRARVHGVRL